MSALAKKTDNVVRFPRAAKPDPIFARIAEWEEAFAHYTKTHEAEMALRNKLDVERIALGRDPARMDVTDTEAFIYVDGDRLTSLAEIDAHLARRLASARAGCAGYKSALAALDKARKVQRKDLVAQLRAARVILAKAQDAAGWSQAVAAYEDASDNADRALRRLVHTKPTTIAGLAALLSSVKKELTDALKHGSWGEGYFAILPGTIAAAAAAIAKSEARAR